jgi:hypothetical protein
VVVSRQYTCIVGAVIASLLFVACTASRAQEVTPAASGKEVKVVIDRRYIQACEFLKWFPYRDSVGTPGGDSTGANASEVEKAGGNVMFLPGDPANIGRYAAYRCGDEQLKKIPRIVTTR